MTGGSVVSFEAYRKRAERIAELERLLELSLNYLNSERAIDVRERQIRFNEFRAQVQKLAGVPTNPLVPPAG